MVTLFAVEGAALLSLRITFSFDVTSLKTCDTVYISGLVFLLLLHTQFVIIFINSDI
uniref:Transmembrane protein n=1 Tax=Medicago truncatula TaxID=3880 RepID=A2Q4G0_MEDTR|nr:hypothetical protein MtrDRAFT_AC157473g28v2 [Medicago truncatula]